MKKCGAAVRPGRAAAACVWWFFTIVAAASAQDRQPASAAPQTPSQPEAAAASQADGPAHQHEAAGGETAAEGALVSSRQGSGTAWLPDATPMYAVHGRTGPWELMGHANVFAQYLFDGGRRGAEQAGSINWIMGMARRPLAGGHVTLNGMISLEPWTIPGCGYPDLLASGELCDDALIVDRQHPHDLFMELAVSYERATGTGRGLQLYGGPVGEPALGPVAYPHRTSAMANPLAPISHHWLDATHISFGVVTAGIFGRTWKAEGSIFNGREPDEERWDVNLAALDSVAGRVWYLPTPSLAFQVSAGRLREAEADHHGGPRVDVDRVTASGTYHRSLHEGASFWATTVAWGRNAEHDESSAFTLLETNLMLHDRHAIFGRLDVGAKHADDLDVHGTDERFTIGKLQAGYVRYVDLGGSLQAGVGATASLGLVSGLLRHVYDGRATPGFGLFVTLRPSAMRMTGSGTHAGDHHE